MILADPVLFSGKEYLNSSSYSCIPKIGQLGAGERFGNFTDFEDGAPGRVRIYVDAAVGAGDESAGSAKIKIGNKLLKIGLWGGRF